MTTKEKSTTTVYIPSEANTKTQAIEAYKSALRKAIEGNLTNVRSVIQQLDDMGKTGNDDWFQVTSTMHTLEHVLHLLDEVQPG